MSQAQGRWATCLLADLDKKAEEVALTEYISLIADTPVIGSDSEAINVFAQALVDKKISRAQYTKFTRATNVINSATTDSKTALAILENAKLARDPWRQKHRQAIESYEVSLTRVTDKPEDAKKDFISKCHNGLMSPHNVMVAMFVMFGTQNAQTSLQAIMLAASTPAEMITLYNWKVAEALGEAFLTKYGPIIMHLQWPLFPPVDELHVDNIKLIDELAAVHGGGDPQRTARFVPSGYKAMAKSTTIAGGAYILPVQQTADGQYGVDVQQAVDASQNHEMRISAIEARSPREQRYPSNRPRRGGRGGGGSHSRYDDGQSFRGGRGGRGGAPAHRGRGGYYSAGGSEQPHRDDSAADSTPRPQNF